MNEIARTRLKVIAILAIVIVLLHIIIIRVFVIGNQGKEEKPSKEKPSKEKLAEVKPVEPVKPAIRFFVKSSNPRFGAPLDFQGALHGDIPASIAPGSKAVKAGIIVDMDSRKVLWEKNCQKTYRIASMTKMMTMLLAMETLEQRTDLKLTDKVAVTQTALKVPRTGVLYLAPGESFSIMELMIATAVKSANDAATLLAEYLDGNSVENFVARMNKRAIELKLQSCRFYNPCGLPDANGNHAVGNAADMVLLGEQLLQYPVVLQWCRLIKGSIRNGKTIFVNTNGLIRNPKYRRSCPGVDGLKTGFLNSAGSCVTFSVRRNNRRIIGCIIGVPSGRERDMFSSSLINWAYKH